MKKENFSNLLTDLYQLYNHEYLQYVPNLVDKYHRMEHSAVEMVFLKYNHKNSPFYDQEKSTEAYILKLVKEYEQGNRILKDAKLVEKKKEEDLQKDKIETDTKKISEEVGKKIEEVKEETAKREEETQKIISEYQKALEGLNKQLSEQKPQNNSHFDAVDIKISLFYTESEIKLPNKEILASLGIGSRILVVNSENKPIGLEVKEITYDCISNIMIGGKPTLEITLERV